jgi:DNA (cytosine-5)-methyltransferase 1
MWMIGGRLMALKVLDLFAGAGGFTLAGELASGYETVAFCEIDKHARKVLAKNWPNVPIFEDVTKLKASDIDGTIDVITGGFPCQDLSSAGSGAGIGAGTRSGLFREMLRLACEVRERQERLPYIIFENVARLLSGPTEAPGEWFGEFLWSLAEVGYDAEWFCITAASVGAPHERERVCVVSYPNTAPIERGSISRRVYQEHADIDGACSWWRDGFSERKFYRVADGVPKRPHDIRNGIMGNAIVPQVFAIPMRALREAHLTSTNTMPIQHNTTSKEDTC